MQEKINQKPGEMAADKETEKILTMIDQIEAVSFDTLLKAGGISRGRLEKILFDLEMKGRIHQPVQGLYQRQSGLNEIFALAHR